MNSQTSHSGIDIQNNFLLFTIVLISVTLLFNACSDTILPGDSVSTEPDPMPYSGLDSKLADKLAEIPNPVSGDPVVRNAERHFIDLSEKIPRFAGFHLDRQNDIHVRDDKLVLLLKGTENTAAAAEKARGLINDRFGKSLGNFGASDVIVKEAQYNFRQLQAFRDILHQPVLETEGVTMIDLAEDKNRIVIGVEQESYISDVEATLSNLPIPDEAVIIEVFNIQQTSSDVNESKEFRSENLLTHKKVQDYVRPLTGGLQIYEGETCTLGMIARFGATNVFITNSHCTADEFGMSHKSFFDQPHPNNYTGNAYIGEELHDVPLTYNDSLKTNVRYSDAATIRLDENDHKFGTVAMTNGRGIEWGEYDHYQIEIPHRTVPPRLTYIDEMESLIDLPVAKVGQLTGGTVGYVKQTCKTIKFPNDDMAFLCQDTAYPLYVQDGDSGAPVFTDYTTDTGEGEALLLGIQHARGIDTKGNTIVIYSPLSGIRKDLETANQGLSFIPVNASIWGNDNIENTGSYTYGTDVENETGSVSYQWRIQWEGSSTWSSLGTNATQDVSVTDDRDYTLKVEVTDDISTDTDLFPVTVVTDECSPAEPCYN